jgi:hypothetical protein
VGLHGVIVGVDGEIVGVEGVIVGVDGVIVGEDGVVVGVAGIIVAASLSSSSNNYIEKYGGKVDQIELAAKTLKFGNRVRTEDDTAEFAL